MNKILLGIAIGSLLSACGGDGDDTPPTTDFDGVFLVSAETITTLDNEGEPCAATATGTATIANGSISGQVVDSMLNTLEISGTVDASGNVTAGFAFDGENVVDFTGTFSGGMGSGTYEGIYECTGTWTMEPSA